MPRRHKNKLSHNKLQGADYPAPSFTPHKFSFLNASMMFSFFTFPIAYSIVTNTTANTLKTATAIAAHGNVKPVSYTEQTTRQIRKEMPAETGRPYMSARIP